VDERDRIAVVEALLKMAEGERRADADPAA
jgi:hypothetical protein